MELAFDDTPLIILEFHHSEMIISHIGCRMHLYYMLAIFDSFKVSI